MKRADPSRALTLLSLVSMCSLTATACSTDAPGDPVDAGPIPDETEKCPTIPRSRLFPIVGAFFGPDPGPCTLASAGNSYIFQYDPESVLQRQAAADGQDDTKFQYAEGLLTSETRTQPSGVSTTTYEYAEDGIESVTIQPDGTTTGYIYELDERGFVRNARLLNRATSASTPTRYTYEYENCVVRWRVAYDRNDRVNLDATLEYFYDNRGHLSRRSSNISEELFDYSCW